RRTHTARRPGHARSHLLRARCNCTRFTSAFGARQTRRYYQPVKVPLLLLVIACSGDREEPRAAPARVESRTSIDVTVHDAPLSIRGVEITPWMRSPGVLELG